MMKALLMVLLVGAASAVPGKLEKWKEFKLKHGKVYKDSAEEKRRMEAFEENSARVEQHMREYAEGKHSFTMALNKFADRTAEEMVRKHKAPRRRPLRRPRRAVSEPYAYQSYQPLGQPVPDEVDWRNSGLVTSVKDEGSCSARWAFSAVGALEGAWAKAGRGLQSLSAQQLIDCSQSHSNNGCSYGYADSAYMYIFDNGGIDSEQNYRYTNQGVGNCNDWAQQAANVSGHVLIPSGSEDALLDAVANVGPVAVEIDGPHHSFWHYSSGVYKEPLCSTDQLDYALLIVGYGTEDGQDYWLCKNSWGAEWGEGGYIKIARNSNNHCGIASWATYPIVG